MSKEPITFESVRYGENGEETGRVTVKFDGDLVLSSPESPDPGFLEYFKTFVLALGYHPNCVDRLVMLEHNEMVVERDWSMLDNERLPVGQVIEMLKSENLAEELLANEQYIRDIATEIMKNRKQNE